ncbi:MAG: hypothetical protein GXO23_02660 [Crenarchaeota archaeon]|nr:hypothetical protein [Thermoproteota archaeon]
MPAVRIDVDELHVGRKKDPQGYYVALVHKDTLGKLIDVVQSSEIYVDPYGDIIILRSRSWKAIQRLINYARSRGIRVLERRE